MDSRITAADAFVMSSAEDFANQYVAAAAANYIKEIEHAAKCLVFEIDHARMRG